MRLFFYQAGKEQSICSHPHLGESLKLVFHLFEHHSYRRLLQLIRYKGKTSCFFSPTDSIKPAYDNALNSIIITIADTQRNKNKFI